MKKFLPQTLILCLVFTAACGRHSAASSAGSPGDSKTTWPSGSTTTLNPRLITEMIKGGVPADLATLALNKYDDFESYVQNPDYITVVDYRRFSGKHRLWMVNTNTGSVDALNVAHGAGSDPDGTGYAKLFSNVPNSKMTSLGAYLISEQFQSTDHGTAMRLDGLESTNSLARDRGLLMHSANYVSSRLDKMGMSWGCTAISLDWIGRALSRLSGGSFMYVFGPATATSALDEWQIQSIMTNPAYKWVNEGEDAPVDGVL
jgi:hypothetical protein